MDEITAMFQLTNLPDVIMSIFIILFGVLAIIKVIEEVSKRIGKPVKWISEQTHDHEILQQVVENMQLLQDHHKADMDDEANRDELLQDQFTHFAEEIRDCITQTQEELKQFSENRASDREQSFAIQKELNESIAKLSEGAVEREKSISALSEGVRELLGDALDQKFSRFVALGSVPENEIDEFVSLANAYFANGGNHRRRERYEYVMNHMKVTPVEVNLLNHEEE